MESCFGTIKTALEMTEYDNRRVARREIGEYIEYYLRERKQSSLGHLTPSRPDQKREGDRDGPGLEVSPAERRPQPEGKET